MTAQRDIAFCPHADRTRVESHFRTKMVVVETCITCAATFLPKLFPKALHGQPFTLKVATAAGGTLVMQGKWEGVPVYLTSKQIGGFLAVVGAGDDD